MEYIFAERDRYNFVSAFFEMMSVLERLSCSRQVGVRGGLEKRRSTAYLLLRRAPPGSESNALILLSDENLPLRPDPTEFA